MSVPDAIEGIRQEIYRLEAENIRLNKEGRALSDAYIKLRSMIPGAFDTPFAPSPQVVWRVTEEALQRLIEKANATNS